MIRILIADDEPIERTIIERMIKKNFPENVEIVNAINGREAVRFYEEKQCQIALLDIEMPGINGLDAADQIRKYDKDAVIIFITAFDEFDYAKRAIQVHALEYLLKPVSEGELVANLEEAIWLTQKTEKKLPAFKADLQETHHENIKMNAVAENIRDYIAKHYKEDISLQDVAGSMNYSDAYFCKIFKQCFDKSFLVFLTEYHSIIFYFSYVLSITSCLRKGIPLLLSLQPQYPDWMRRPGSHPQACRVSRRSRMYNHIPLLLCPCHPSQCR